MTVFAENLVSEMERQGTNAAEVARAAKLNPTAVYDILKGKSQNPRLDTLEKIAAALDVPLLRLLAGPRAVSLDAEIMDCLARLPLADRERFHAMARAMLANPPRP